MKLFARRNSRVVTAGYSVVDNALAISGDIDTSGTIRVDGRLEGAIHRADTLIIGADGHVIGDVVAREVIVGGEFNGNALVSERLEIQAAARIRGDIRAAAVHLIEGATVHGHIIIQPVDADIPALPRERRLSLTPGVGSKAIAQG